MKDQLQPRHASARNSRGPFGNAALYGVVPAVVALGLSAPLADVQAAEWTLAPDVRVGAHYNDNYRLREDEADVVDVLGAFIDLGVLAQWRTPTSIVQIRPRLHSSKYPDNEDEESNDAYLDFSARNAGERTAWALRGNYAREQVIRGEQTRVDFADPELDGPEDDATGRIDSRRKRTLWRLAPSFSYELSERRDVGGSLGYTDVKYAPQLPGEALDYTEARAEAFFAQALSPISRIRATVFATAFEVDEISNDSTTYGLRARYERDITEVYNVYVDAGLQRTDVEAGTAGQVDDSSTGVLFDAGVRRQWERTELRIAGGRSVLPSGSGFLSETDQVRINLRHQFRPRWFGELAGVALTSSTVADSTTTFNERDRYQLRARVGYELTRDWTIEGSYSFIRQDYQDTPGSASAAEVYLSANYQPRGRVWSR